jgi:molybdopterin-guanine dinucleotide biosynthesis protein A
LRNNHEFAANEIAILGTRCDEIERLVTALAAGLTQYKLAYFDALHEKDLPEMKVSTFTFHSGGTVQANERIGVNKFYQRIQFSQYDMVFINGNHYKGARQILVLDPEKEGSVERRLDQLDRIEFVIKKQDAFYYDFLKSHYPQIENLRSYPLQDISAITRHVKNLIEERIAPVQGLVLAGGKSQRMGTDKGALEFFGKKQRDVAVELLRSHRLKTYLSVREEQEIDADMRINDVFLGLGPFGALCSAFQFNPDTAWLVLATDLPFVNDEIISLLLTERDPSKAATSIKGKSKQFVEPLITIWEPRSYPLLLAYLSQGYSCPRKVLINSDVKVVEVDDTYIRNINTPEDLDAALRELHE